MPQKRSGKAEQREAENGAEAQKGEFERVKLLKAITELAVCILLEFTLFALLTALGCLCLDVSITLRQLFGIWLLANVVRVYFGIGRRKRGERD